MIIGLLWLGNSSCYWWHLVKWKQCRYCDTFQLALGGLQRSLSCAFTGGHQLLSPSSIIIIILDVIIVISSSLSSFFHHDTVHQSSAYFSEHLHHKRYCNHNLCNYLWACCIANEPPETFSTKFIPSLLKHHRLTNKGEVHGPMHPCHVHSDLLADMSHISRTRPLIFQRLPLPILGLPTAPQLGKFWRMALPPPEILSCFVSVGWAMFATWMEVLLDRKILVWWRLGPNSRSRSLINLTNL